MVEKGFPLYFTGCSTNSNLTRVAFLNAMNSMNSTIEALNRLNQLAKQNAV